eukprot:c55876_g1_i1.p1 GENE.c55876_g1_i1~~c55876_g1_i1.p1  ORF type:complete len:577 (+),score=91.15 c55876_g1_i1:33-1733(+)
MYGSAGKVNITSCICVRGAYTLDGAGTPCTLCPKEATCAGELEPPRAKKGFAQVAPGVFARCPIPDACLAGGGCATGYGGYLCKDCVVGYYADQTGRCLKCPSAASALSVIYYVLIVLAGIAFAIATVLLASNRADESAPKTVVSAAAVRTRVIPPSISMLVTAFQIAGVVAVAEFSWPDPARTALNFFNFFSLDVSLFSTSCSAGTGSQYARNYIVGMLSPLLFAAALLLTAVALRLLRPWVPKLNRLSKVPMGPMLLSALFAVGPLLYLPLARTTLSLFNCRKLPFTSRYYLVADLSFICFGKVWGQLLPLGIIGLFLYVALIPLAITVTLVTSRDRLYTDMSIIRRYGSLYKLVRRPMFLLPVALLGKKLAIAICSLFLSQRQEYQIALLLFIVLGGGMAQSKLMPYYFPLYERLDFSFTIMLSVLLICGMIAFSSRGEGASVRNSSAFVIAAVVWTMVFLIIGAIGFFIADVRQIRAARKRAKSPEVTESVHEKRIRLFLQENMVDVDCPDAFVSSLVMPADAKLTADPAAAEVEGGMALSPLGATHEALAMQDSSGSSSDE